MQGLIANRYRVLSELGRGGMGAVYRVADTFDNDREVALKTTLTTGAVTPELRLRFKEEFLAMAKLKHPNTIAVYDYGRLDDHGQFITMELVEGEDLQALIGGDRLPYEQVYSLLIQLLQALGFIHARLYVHRDIKSQNIRVKPDGTLTLMDFGLMGQLGLRASGGSVTGSPDYLPPEVVKGGVIDASSDLYAVGCLAFELLTGRVPFQGAPMQVVRAHLFEAPPPLRSLRTDVPEALERIVMRLLDKDQRRRYQDAQEVIGELAGLAGLEVARTNLAQKKSYLTSSALIGREAELARLGNALAASRAGQGRSILVGAPAGVGKSRLVEEVLLQAKLEDGLVLRGRCLETGTEPYAPVAEALRPLLALTTPEGLAGYALALKPLFPELEVQDDPEDDSERVRERLHRTVIAWVAELAAAKPIVLLLEDLHWADPRSVEVFNHAVRGLASAPVLCLGTFRNDETRPESAVWYAIHDGDAEHLKLEPLDVPGLGALLSAMVPGLDTQAGLTEFLYGVTAGNPFFLTEVARFLMEEGVLTLRDGQWHLLVDVRELTLPESLEATVARRLASLSPHARVLAGVAAVMGPYQARDMLLSVSGMEESALFQALDELVERQFLLREPNGYALPHDLVRRTLYAGTPPAMRQELHQRCGEFLERHREDPSAVLQELARHFHRGTDRRKAYEYLRLAGTASEAAGIDALAIAQWQAAEAILAELDYPDKAARQLDLWMDIGGSGFLLAPKATLQAFQKALAAFEAGHSQDAARHQQATLLLSLTYGLSGHPVEGIALIDRVLAGTAPEDTTLRAALNLIRTTNMVPLGHIDAGLALLREVSPVLFDQQPESPPPIVRRTRVGAAAMPNISAYQGIRPDERALERSIMYSEQIHDHTHFTARHYFGLWYAWTGRQDGAQAFLDTSAQTCRTINSPPTPWMLYVRSYLLWQRGEFEESRALVAQAYDSPQLAATGVPFLLVQVLDGQIHLALGNLEEAGARLRSAEADARARQLGVVRLRALLALAELAIAREDWPGARVLLEEVKRLSEAGPLRNPLHRAIALKLLGEVATGERKPAEARTHLDAALAIFRLPEQDNVIEQAHTHRLLAELHATTGDPVAAEEAFRQAGGIFFRLKNVYWLHAVAGRLDALSRPAQAPPAPMTEARMDFLIQRMRF